MNINQSANPCNLTTLRLRVGKEMQDINNNSLVDAIIIGLLEKWNCDILVKGSI